MFYREIISNSSYTNCPKMDCRLEFLPTNSFATAVKSSLSVSSLWTCNIIHQLSLVWCILFCSHIFICLKDLSLNSLQSHLVASVCVCKPLNSSSFLTENHFNSPRSLPENHLLTGFLLLFKYYISK